MILDYSRYRDQHCSIWNQYSTTFHWSTTQMFHDIMQVVPLNTVERIFNDLCQDYKAGTPGDYGWMVIASEGLAEKTRRLSSDIENGSLAMVVILGIFWQDGLTGSAGASGPCTRIPP